jgi:hypothetical protein
MSAPAIALCRCGHAERRHNDEEGCANSECGCVGYREGSILDTPAAARASTPPPTRPTPSPAPARPTLTANTNAPTVDQILAAGRRSTHKRTLGLVAKIEGLTADLRARLRDERAAAETKAREDAVKEQVRAEVTALEAQLAAARAKLRGDRTPPSAKSTPASGDVSCDQADCTRSFVTKQALAMHKWRAHDLRKGE